MSDRIEIAAEDIREGDLIRHEYAPGATISGRAVEYHAKHDGYRYSHQPGTLYLLDRPKPAVALPTEPGWYLDMHFGLWLFNKDGYRAIHAPPATGWFSADHLRQFAPFTLLRPVAEVAAEVLAALDLTVLPPGAPCYYERKYAGTELREIAAKFGVTL